MNTVIVGAGPYGLSISAHLTAAGVDHRIFGPPMDMWRNHMPPGMCLKSYGESSSLFDPQSALTLERYTGEHGIAYHASRVSVRLDTFVAYGVAFQERFVPHLELKRLVALRPAGGSHELEFDDGERVVTKNVVLAIGVMPYRHMPRELVHLPATSCSHSSDYGSLDALEGKKVTVVGSGSSALDLAALLSERRTAVTIVARNSQLHFQTMPGSGPPSLLKSILYPASNGLGDGWLMCMCADAPRLFRLLPDRTRLRILSTSLGPSGGYFIREQVEKHVTLKLSRSIERAEERGGRVRLTTVDASGSRETIESDHLIAATGYRVDLRRLEFLGDETLRRIRMVDGAPILSSDFESSVSGLYFVGLTAARTFGPVMRFTVGAVHPARQLVRRLGGVNRSGSVTARRLRSIRIPLGLAHRRRRQPL
jgi:thioredoxin reductase